MREKMNDAPLLMIPGPTNLHRRVLDALSLPQIAHTGPQFYSEFLEILQFTRKLFITKQNVVVFSGSGTSGMESVVASLLEKGESVLSVETGYFGRRFTTIAEIYGVQVDKLVFNEGEAASVDTLSEKLDKKRYSAVLLTHIETSTGVRNPIRELVSEARKHDVLTFVDTVCGLGGEEFRFDDWGVDVAFSASQKSIAAPPGAALVALSERAVEKLRNRKTQIPSYYYNLAKWLEVMEDPKIYLTTPSTSVLRALRVALQMLHEEGLEKRWNRHEALAEAFRKGLVKSGIHLFSRSPANTVTAIKTTKAPIIAKRMLEDYNIMVARGLDSHKDDMIRIGHMGNVSEHDLIKTLISLIEIMKSVGERIQNADSIQPLLDLSH